MFSITEMETDLQPTDIFRNSQFSKLVIIKAKQWFSNNLKPYCIHYLSQLTDEENEHDPKECGSSSCAHQDDHLNIRLAFIA